MSGSARNAAVCLNKGGIVLKNEITKYYIKSGSIKETAAVFGVGWQKARKILITDNVYESEKSKKIKEMYDDGMTEGEIAEKMKMKEKTVSGYLPYRKGEYNLENPSQNAIELRKWRKKKKEEAGE